MEFKPTNQECELLKYKGEIYYQHRRGTRLPVITWRCRHNKHGCQAILKTLNKKINES